MNSSNSSDGDLGNTASKSPLKQSSPCKRWCFTLHNYENKDVLNLIEYFSSNSSYIFSKELGSSGTTPHLQGYFELKDKLRRTALSKALGATIHFEKAKGTRDDNIRYITKEGGEVFENILPEKIYCEEPADKLKFLIDIMKRYDFPKGDRLIHAVVDNVGGLGKTEFARYCCLNFERCIISGGKSADMFNQIVNFKEKHGTTPKYIIFDIPRSTLNYISYQGIEKVKDMLFYSGKYEGDMIVGNKPCIIMLMNETPNLCEMSKDRWRIYEIDNE